MAGVFVSMKGVVVDTTPAAEACWNVVVRFTGEIGPEGGAVVEETVGGEMGVGRGEGSAMAMRWEDLV